MVLKRKKKEKEMAEEEANNTRKALFDVGLVAFGAEFHFISGPSFGQPFVKHRRVAGKEFSPLRSSFVVERTRRGDTPDGNIARVDFCEGKTRHFSLSSSSLSRFRPSFSAFASFSPRERFDQEKNSGTKMFLF